MPVTVTQRLHRLYTKIWVDGKDAPSGGADVFKEVLLPVPLQSCFLPHPAMQEKVNACSFLHAVYRDNVLFQWLMSRFVGEQKADGLRGL